MANWRSTKRLAREQARALGHDLSPMEAWPYPELGYVHLGKCRKCQAFAWVRHLDGSIGGELFDSACPRGA